VLGVSQPPLVDVDGAFERNASRGRAMTPHEAAAAMAAARGRRPQSAPRADDGHRRRRSQAGAAAPPPRMLAEFEPMDGVLVRFPLGLPVELIAAFSEHTNVYCLCDTQRQSAAESTFAAAGTDLERLTFINMRTDSYWTRDYGPWWILEQPATPQQLGDDVVTAAATATAIGDFVYNRNRPHDTLVASQLASEFDVGLTNSELLLTGGNMMVDGAGYAAATTLLYTENAPGSTVGAPWHTWGQDGAPAGGWEEDEVDAELLSHWGVVMRAFDDPTGTYIEHIDCWAKFLNPTTMLISAVPAAHSRFRDYEAAAAHYAQFYTVVRVNVGMDVAPYTNSLILNDRVYVPVLGGGHAVLDQAALAVYAENMPDITEIIGVPGVRTAPWQPTDALHCRSGLYLPSCPDDVLLSLHRACCPNEWPCTPSSAAECAVCGAQVQVVVAACPFSFGLTMDEATAAVLAQCDALTGSDASTSLACDLDSLAAACCPPDTDSQSFPCRAPLLPQPGYDDADDLAVECESCHAQTVELLSVCPLALQGIANSTRVSLATCANSSEAQQQQSPVSCRNLAEFSALNREVTALCCEPPASCGSDGGGAPDMCSETCATVLVPMHAACSMDPNGYLNHSPSTATLQAVLDEAVALCE
jgi:agmatine/peptidylarginine deiminase